MTVTGAAAKASAQEVQLGFGHGALDAEQEPIVEVGGVVEAVLVGPGAVGLEQDADADLVTEFTAVVVAVDQVAGVGHGGAVRGDPRRQRVVGGDERDHQVLAGAERAEIGACLCPDVVLAALAPGRAGVGEVDPVAERESRESC